MADEAQRSAWNKAQSLEISVDLVAAAKDELLLLALVNVNPWLYEGQALKRAIHRYTDFWLPFAIAHGKDAQAKFPPAPPLDCAWIWHCHRLNPVQYAQDCKELYGAMVDAPLIPLEHRDAAAIETEKLWRAKFPDEPYNLDASNTTSPTCQEQGSAKITYDLEDAVSRQKSFYYHVSQPHYLDESFLQAAEERYKAFLYITTLDSNFFVPTYDVDVMWHAHQRSPVAYSRDSLRILGKVLQHDTDSDRSKGKKLDTGFQTTRAIWEKTFGFPYEKVGCMYRGKQPPPLLMTFEDGLVLGAGCGSGCNGSCGGNSIKQGSGAASCGSCGGAGGCGSFIGLDEGTGCGSGCGSGCGGGCGSCGAFVN